MSCEKCFAIFKVTVWGHIIVSAMSSALVNSLHSNSECYVKNALLSSRSRSQCGGHIIISAMSSVLVIPLQSNCLMEHHHKPDCLVKRPQIALFKVKFILTVQQIIEYLSILYFLYY